MNQLDLVNRLYGKPTEVRKIKFARSFFIYILVQEPGEDADVDLRSMLSGQGSLHSTYEKTILQNLDIKKWVQKSDITTRRAIDEDDFDILPGAAVKRADDEFIINELQGEWML